MSHFRKFKVSKHIVVMISDEFARFLTMIAANFMALGFLALGLIASALYFGVIPGLPGH
ncbi:hypothetical protein [Streptomyces chilikensis]|uniref:Uncharacterized protein n=1 Tax=Streptomyces chilikensis TaxID=1194079 RepID=A0ABV3EM09_9ACTN